jgi:hypothetical protein
MVQYSEGNEEANRVERLNKIQRGEKGPISVSGTEKERNLAIEGLERGMTYYGQNQEQTGEQVQDIVKRRRDALDQKGPDATRLRESRNRKIRMAKASGASPEQIKQIERESEMDIEDTSYKQGQYNLDKYQSMVGNILSNQMGLEMGFRQLGKAGEVITPPQQQGMMDSVICSELYRQGYISDEVLDSDREFGFYVRRYDPSVYIGYIKCALPVVRLMKKSKLFTKLISIPTLCWANWMHTGKGYTGRTIHNVGAFFCRFIGDIITAGRFNNEIK